MLGTFYYFPIIFRFIIFYSILILNYFLVDIYFYGVLKNLVNLLKRQHKKLYVMWRASLVCPKIIFFYFHWRLIRTLGYIMKVTFLYYIYNKQINYIFKYSQSIC